MDRRWGAREGTSDAMVMGGGDEIMEGVICPMCMKDMRTVELLLRHFEEVCGVAPPACMHAYMHACHMVRVRWS